MNEWIAFIGIFIGVLIRTLLPAMRKALEASPEEPFKWDHRYTVTAVMAAVLAMFVALMTLPRFTPPEGNTFIIFVEGLTFALTGSGINSLINEAASWLGTPGLHGSKT